MNLHEVRETICEALDDLPKDADEIASAFEEAGITGYMVEARRCPLAKYVTQETGFTVGVAGETVVPEAYFQVAVFLPRQIRKFVDKFDDGEYPNLVEAVS
jgi:hypothetical protein